MLNYISVKDIWLKGIGSLLLLSIMVKGDVMPTRDEIKKATNGKGVFAVAVTNASSRSVLFGVSVAMGKAPQGCKYLTIGNSGSFRIGVKETKVMELPVPFVSTQEWKDIDQYDNVDDRLPLDEDSKVYVQVKNVCGEPCIERRIFKAEYLAGTRLVKLPQRISITINCDPVKYKYSDPTSQWIKNIMANIKTPEEITKELIAQILQDYSDDSEDEALVAPIISKSLVP